MLRKYQTVVFLSLSLSFLRIAAVDINYCEKHRCGNERHTICKLKHDCSINSKNCRDFEEALLTNSDKQLLVDLHNKFRSLVATGKASLGKAGYKLPTASNMKEMVWDKEVEFIAQCWANQCLIEHDHCREKSDGTYVGQNIAASSATTTDQLLENMITSLYSEIQHVIESDITEFGGPNWVKIGHFSQLVYCNSTQLGCARVRYSQKYLLVCNYAPGANWAGSKIYSKGKPCASCPENCHAKYPGLCKTPRSSSRIPNICPYSKNKNCKPILQSGQDEKSGAQELPHGIFNCFGTKVLTASVALFSTIVEC